MSFVIDLPEHLQGLMEVLPRHTCVTIHLMLARIAELAAHWAPDDWRWKQIAYRDDEGLRFYVQGCCVRLCLEPETRRVRVREIGRVVVRLSSERLDCETGARHAPA